MRKIFIVLSVIITGSLGLTPLVSQGALTVDRSRLIINESDKSVSVKITNRNANTPYLLQGWIEDERENKTINSLMVLPPVQRIEGGEKTLIRVQKLPDITLLPTDRESVFYLNIREIPPKSDKKNVLTLAIQSRLKVFYRPDVLKVDSTLDSVPGTEKLTLTKKDGRYELSNPTPYYFSFVGGKKGLKGNEIMGFDPIMVQPKSRKVLPLTYDAYGESPVLAFVNDYGSQRLLPFSCKGSVCTAGKAVGNRS